MAIRQRIGGALARFLSRDRPGLGDGPTSDLSLLRACLRPGDVLLVEGTSRFSTAIKYLTQSTWSHAAICLSGGADAELLEADLNTGVRRVPLETYAGYHTRICRPAALRAEDLDSVLAYLTARVGHQYDLRHIIDLARYLLPTPPVPVRWRRRMLTLGSGDPTRAICSSLIAQAFQAVHYPILPVVEYVPCPGSAPGECVQRTMRRRHHTLFTPRDFDISPYFAVVKPVLEHEFDPSTLPWADPAETSR
ncbi:lipo-like protein [Aquisalimonas lutea]|uniref:lipo-like protein n=1 Tax=Aquisalimonas lutea TaxID=1327750 RepID=UPI0025B49B2B|nr:lipo-like protein [Aquisalimonas lutea]MDN3516449.1 lipo-like protein [Aquisalimonas lutea]